MKVRVYYDDTDAGGVMYHTNYIKYCERARSEIIFLANIKMDDENGYFLVKNLEADYIKSCKLGDLIDIKTSLLKAKKASLSLLQEIYLNNEVIFKLNITIVYIKNGKITAIPKEKLALIS